MPKVYATGLQREQASASAGDDAIRLTVATRMMRDRLTQAQIAKMIGISPPTLTRRLAHPEMFTLKELRRLQSALGFTNTEAANCL